MDVVILAAGKGERLKPITGKIPKPLIKVSGRPLIEWTINELCKYNLNNIYVVVNHMKEKIIEFLNNLDNNLNKKHKLKINYIYQPRLLGEVNAISLLPNNLSDNFIVIMGDTIIKDLDYKKLIILNYPGIVVKRTKDTLRKGIIEGKNGFISSCYYNFDKKFNKDKLVDFGTYILPKYFIEIAKKINNPEEKKIYIPDLINKEIKRGKKFMYFEHKGDVIHITSLEDLKKY